MWSSVQEYTSETAIMMMMRTITLLKLSCRHCSFPVYMLESVGGVCETCRGLGKFLLLQIVFAAQLASSIMINSAIYRQSLIWVVIARRSGDALTDLLPLWVTRVLSGKSCYL